MESTKQLPSTITPSGSWGSLLRDIWIMIIAMEISDYNVKSYEWSETMRNPAWCPAGLIKLEYYDGLLHKGPMLNTSFREEVLRAVCRNVMLLFDDPSSLHGFQLNLAKTNLHRQDKLCLRRMTFTIQLLTDLESHAQIDTMLENMINKKNFPGLEDLVIEFARIDIRCQNRFLSSIEEAAAFGDRDAWRLFHRVVRMPVKKFTVLGLVDEALAHWMEGFVTGDWRMYDGVLAEDAARLEEEGIEERCV